MEKLLSPLEFFGFEPGSDRNMLHWNDIVRYFELLDAASPRVKVENMGLSTEGNAFICAYISSESNIAELERYRAISRRLADPRGLPQDEIDRLAAEGKAVCLQMMGLHSNEVGGTQCAPTLAYELASAATSELTRILENTILILIPCANPDGEIDFYDWYYLNKDTPREGMCSPHLRHKYAGHSNNRDGVHVNLIETVYINRLISDWMPQAFLDQHHQSPEMDRLTIAPYVNPINPEISPLLMREMEWYGGSMACALSKAGVKGVVTGDEFYPDWLMFSPQTFSRLKNIAGILAESADALIATPIYMHPDRLDAHTVPSAECPEPWPGGWWQLSDIVYQMKITALAVLGHMAKNREEVLGNMAFKALAQTKRGADDPVQAILIPRRQHDMSAARHLVEVLRQNGVEVFELAELVGEYPEGTLAVPLAQPNYAVAKILLSRTVFPVNQYTKKPDGSVRVFDLASLDIAENMGVEVAGANAQVKLREAAPVETPDGMPASENESYRRANALINAGTSVCRDENGDFNTEGKGKRVVIPKIGVFKFDGTGNSEAGFTRLLLEKYGFPYRLVQEREVRNGGIDDLDVVILPGDEERRLVNELGNEGFEAFRRLEKRGGRVVAWGESCMYAVRTVGRQIGDYVKGLPLTQYDARGSTLRVEYTSCELTLGMPEKGLILNTNGPVIFAGDFRLACKYHVFARFAPDKLLSSGYLRGEEYLAGRPCAMRVEGETGDAVVYGFDPKFRMQTDATYKLLFNALYREA